MPGRMDDNLRHGNNTENLGLHLLRAVGAVAPVPRDQDIGIDAIVTLLKRDDGRRLVSGSTVFVQLKSASVRRLVFQQEDLEWLNRLELPYFVGSVDSANASLSLYTIHSVMCLLGPDLGEAELCLDLESRCVNPPIKSKEEFEEWLALDARSIKTKVYLGPPVLAWNLNDSNDSDFLSDANDVLESWVKISQETRLLATMGETLAVNWKTGGLPEDSGSIGSYQAGDNSRDHAVRLFNIALKRVSMEASLNGDVPALQSLLEAVSHFKKHGVEDRDVIAAGVAAKLGNKAK